MATTSTRAHEPVTASDVNSIHVNHVGFPLGAAKNVVVTGPIQDHFDLYRLSDTNFTLVFSGALHAQGAELGGGLVGDFSDFDEEGIYRIECGNAISHCFVIGREVYRSPATTLLNFFRLQRCGDTETGWASPCHVDDQIVLSTGETRDLTGGYHQSSDLRKWPWGISLALVGLVEAALEGSPGRPEEALLSEIRTGGEYLRKLQRDDGGMIDSTFVPKGFEGRAPGEVRGFENPRALWGTREFWETDGPAPAQWQTIRFNALASRLFQSSDPDLAQVSLDAAQRGWDYMTRPDRDFSAYQATKIPPQGHGGLNSMYIGFTEDSALENAHRLCAALAMYRATDAGQFLDEAVSSARALCALQLRGADEKSSPDLASFRVSATSPMLANSFFYYWQTSGPIGLVELLKTAPEHSSADMWRSTVRSIAEQYRAVAGRNPYGRLAAAWHRDGANPFDSAPFFSHASESNRPDGRYFWEDSTKSGRIFYEYYGYCSNLDLMAGAVFLGKAATLLNEPAYATLAQRALDWILGSNPFNASSVEGVGYNQPHRGLFGEFFPPVPQMPGAVFVGFDEDSFDPTGHGNSNEYDLPMGGWLSWLLSERSGHLMTS